ncbi:MAG: GNAT family N-acetyltransferase [Acidimicrobiales bacterium]|jgi:GNAT superfamily N-acetyltransferase|nr:GNAT family N-acetyltransferase [Acidimicrobiales bacterium]
MATIVRAVSEDLSVLLPLVAEFCELDHHPYDEDRVARALGPLLADDAFGQVWLVRDEAGGPPIGYAVVTWGYSVESGGREALLDEIFVRDRSRGLGSEALRELLTACRAQGIRRMFLETEAHNTRVRRFYVRHGFAVEDSIWMSAEL